MAHGRDAKSGNRGGTKGKGKLAKDAGCHSVPGFTGGDGAPGSWPARTGYAEGRKTGGSSKSTKVSIHGKSG